jgi:hypothetical protein
MRILRPKREKLIRKWRMLRSKELCNLYFLLNTVRVIRESEAGDAFSMREIRSEF